MAYQLCCGVCGEPFQPNGITLQEMIFQVGRLLCHAEPCSIFATDHPELVVKED